MDAVGRDHALLETIAKDRLNRRLARIEPMLAGLGTRRFHRLFFESGDPRTLIARFEADVTPPPPEAPADEEAPPAWLPEPPLEPLRTFLADAGLPVPTSALHAPEHGLDLLEDVGDRTIGMLSHSAREQRTREACALLPRLQALMPPSGSGIDPATVPAVSAFDRAYDLPLVESKAWKWLHWTIPLILGRPATDDETRETMALFSQIADLAETAPKRLSHRDFKAENLHLVAAPSERLVMIDVQGAFMAPPEYDLVCILYDLQVELDEGFVWEVFEQTRGQLPDAPEPAASQERFDALAIARLCKDVSHVIHASRVRGDSRRWPEVPRGLELLKLAAGRQAHTFLGAQALSSVIEALTAALESTDSPE